jgi:hypothetical protein
MNTPPIQYYFPKYGKTTPPDALGAIFEGRPLNRSQSSAHGPRDTRGTFFSYFPDTTCQFVPTRQRVARFVTYDDRSGDEIEYFIVVDNTATPDDFIRERTLPGWPVAMQHGEWLIPVANPLVESCVVPYFEMTEDGDNWFKEYKEEYLEATQAAMEMAGQIRQMMIDKDSGAEGLEMDNDDLRRLICTMIGVNYRLTLNEMVALRLFDQEKYLEMVYSFVDATETFKLMAQGEANGENPFPVPPDGKDIASGNEDS